MAREHLAVEAQAFGARCRLVIELSCNGQDPCEEESGAGAHIVDGVENWV